MYVQICREKSSAYCLYLMAILRYFYFHLKRNTRFVRIKINDFYSCSQYGQNKIQIHRSIMRCCLFQYKNRREHLQFRIFRRKTLVKNLRERHPKWETAFTYVKHQPPVTNRLHADRIVTRYARCNLRVVLRENSLRKKKKKIIIFELCCYLHGLNTSSSRIVAIQRSIRYPYRLINIIVSTQYFEERQTLFGLEGSLGCVHTQQPRREHCGCTSEIIIFNCPTRLSRRFLIDAFRTYYAGNVCFPIYYIIRRDTRGVKTGAKKELLCLVFRI